MREACGEENPALEGVIQSSTFEVRFSQLHELALVKLPLLSDEEASGDVNPRV